MGGPHQVQEPVEVRIAGLQREHPRCGATRTRLELLRAGPYPPNIPQMAPRHRDKRAPIPTIPLSVTLAVPPVRLVTVLLARSTTPCPFRGQVPSCGQQHGRVRPAWLDRSVAPPQASHVRREVRFQSR